MILVLNFGSQFAHLIARRIRDLGVHSEIVNFDISAEELLSYKPKGLIFSGGPQSVLDAGSARAHSNLLTLGIPILGICYGMQLIAQSLNGKVVATNNSEYGKEILSINKEDEIFASCEQKEIVWFSHNDQVTKLPPGFIRLASTNGCEFAAIANPEKRIYGLQFHPEVSHTENGEKILANFIFNICQAKKDWQISSLKENILEQISSIEPDAHVLIAVSGGVDSLVVADLVFTAIGERAHAVLIDNGLLRKDEAKQVLESLSEVGINWLKVYDASEIFLRRLQGVSDPEEKRKIIGHTFIEVFEDYVDKNLRQFPIKYLAQGTIYPDRIESAQASDTAEVIKSHHNLSLPEDMELDVLEPIQDLYKDEVRELGLSLGLSKKLLFRHPFPGPGLAIRVVGKITKERIKLLQEVDAIYIEELQKRGLYQNIWQAFAALLPVRTVGVMGDSRSYDYMVSLRAVNSVDGMTADWYSFDAKDLAEISNRIINEVDGVNRVVYDITQKPPGTIEYE